MKVFEKLKYLILAIGFVGLFFVLNLSSIAGVIFPFAFSMMFALVWANQKIWLVCPAYLFTSLLLDFSVGAIVSAVSAVAFLVVPYLVHFFCKKTMAVWELAIFAFLSQIAKVVFAATSGNVNAIYYAVASAAIGVLFMLGLVTLFEAIFVRGTSFRLSLVELVSGGTLLMAIAGGLVSVELYGFSFLKLFVSFVLLAITYCSKSYYSIFVAAILGFGTLLSTLNPIYLAPFILWALAISPFKSYRKYFSAVALVAAELVRQGIRFRQGHF